MTEREAIVAAIRRAPSRDIRFGKCEIRGRQGYRWGSVDTCSVEVMQAVLALWNNRNLIADALSGDHLSKPEQD